MPEHVVETATVEPRLTAVVAQATGWERYPQLWPQLLDEVYRYARPRPELGGPDPRERRQDVMRYEDDVPNVEVGVLVAVSFRPEGRVVVSELPGGRVARTVHRGDDAELGSAHDAVHRFAAASDLELAGPRWEIYGHRADRRVPETEVYRLLR